MGVTEIKMSDLMGHVKQGHDVDLEAIGKIDGDVIGASLFINIMLSFGAFLSSFFLLFTILSFCFLALDFDDDYIWIYLTVAAVSMIGAGYKSHSENSLFSLRLSTFFMYFGKLALIALVLERVYSFYDYKDIEVAARYMAPAGLVLAALNMYIGKSKLEIFLLLLTGFMLVTFFSTETPLFYGMADRQVLSAFGYGFWIRALMWIWVMYMLLFKDEGYKDRLPFYAFIVALMSIGNVSFFSTHNGIFEIMSHFNLVLVDHFLTNFLLLLPSIYLMLKLQKNSEIKLSWQFMACFALLVVGCFLPISDLYVILLAFIFGYAYRDRYILVCAYILTPLFVYGLYHDLQLSLDNAALLALMIGLLALAVYLVVRFTKFDVKET